LYQDLLEGDISLVCSCDHYGGTKQLDQEIADQSNTDAHSLWGYAITNDTHQMEVRREVQNGIDERFVLQRVRNLAVRAECLGSSLVLEGKATLVAIAIDCYDRVVIFRIPVAGQIL
jgi:hypothetical protein